LIHNRKEAKYDIRIKMISDKIWNKLYNIKKAS
jgi:hypothetical protein